MLVRTNFTMKSRQSFLVSLVSCFAVSCILADDCRPLPVQNVDIDASSVLSWSPNPSETCDVESYLVHINDGVTVEYTYIVRRTTLDLDFLPVCESYRFSISPVTSSNITGTERVYYAKMPLPPDANLTVALVMVSEHGQEVYLRWVMDDEWEQCADRFRVIIVDEDDDSVVDEYTRDSSINITHLKPCTHYTFGVVALYNLVLEGPITVVRRTISEDVLSPPTLQAIDVRQTSAVLTWGLEDYKLNRCEVKGIAIRSADFNVTQDVVDQPFRQPVSVQLNNLRASSIYILNVTILNIAGYSTPTILAIQTLD